MFSELVAPAITGLFVGLIPIYLYCKGKMDIKNLIISQQDKDIEILKSKIEEQAAYHQKEIENSKNNELTVLAYPYTEEDGDDGFITDSRRAEVGYKYQLFIRGVPCFEPHKVVLQELTKKEVVQSKIDALVKQALHVIESISDMHPAIATAKAGPAILDKVIASELLHK